jgi:hypothetical protein
MPVESCSSRVATTWEPSGEMSYPTNPGARAIGSLERGTNQSGPPPPKTRRAPSGGMTRRPEEGLPEELPADVGLSEGRPTREPTDVQETDATTTSKPSPAPISARRRHLAHDRDLVSCSINLVDSMGAARVPASDRRPIFQGLAAHQAAICPLPGGSPSRSWVRAPRPPPRGPVRLTQVRCVTCFQARLHRLRSSELHHSREWRNGRRAGLRIRCPKGRGGSTPPSRTNPGCGSSAQSFSTASNATSSPACGIATPPTSPRSPRRRSCAGAS